MFTVLDTLALRCTLHCASVLQPRQGAVLRFNRVSRAVDMLARAHIALWSSPRALAKGTPHVAVFQGCGQLCVPARGFAKALPQVPALDEADLHEVYAAGGGKGGQKVNRTRNKVTLTHVPTGLSVACHRTRSLHDNRRIARSVLAEKVDALQRGAQSRAGVKAARARKAKAKAAARARAKHGTRHNHTEDTGTTLQGAQTSLSALASVSDAAEGCVAPVPGDTAGKPRSKAAAED